MSNPAHGRDRGYPPGGYVVNGSTVTITQYMVWNGAGYSVAKKLRSARKQAKYAYIFRMLAPKSNVGDK